MPAMMSDGMNLWIMIGAPGSGWTRFAIVALGLVVAIVTLPSGQSLTLLGGQTAVTSLSLQIGDAYA